jgi:Rod binding domain-containing protein
MNLSFPTKSVSNSASQLAESTLASGSQDPSDLGFSSLLSKVMKPNEVDISDSKASDELQSKETTLKVDSQEKDIEQEKLREAFHNFVGQTFFSQMLSSLRSTQEGAAYFNGGQTEKIFQGQLDQVLSEELTKSSADQIADPMFELFQLQRSQ